jgi:sugar phosphate isomerase/epimerase
MITRKEITRRDLGKLAGLALPLSALAPSAAFAAKINSTIHGVRIGAQSYSFRTMPLDEAIKAFVDCGLGEAEVFASHVETAAGAPPMQFGRNQDPAEAKAKREEMRKWRLTVPLEKFADVGKKFKDAGINVHGYNLSFREDFSDEEISRGFDMAKALGAKFLTASSTIAAAKRVAPFADKHKMIVSMHGHSNTKNPNEFAKPESFADAMAMSKYFHINLDIGHFFAAGYDPVAYIKEHHDKITNIHLKDRKKDDGPNTVWGEGETPIKDVLQLLKKEKYPIYADIEYEYRGAADPVTEVKKCFEYIKNALA